MPGEPGNPADHGRQLRTLLRTLSSRSLRFGIIDGGKCSGPIHLIPQRSDAASLTVDAQVFRLARDRKWIMERGENWQLTQTGADILRRIGSGTQPVCEVRPATNDAESPLAWLRRRKGANGQPFLEDAEFDAGESLGLVVDLGAR